MRTLAVAFIAVSVIALAGCAKGVDRKLDFSKGMDEFDASYGKALVDAHPAQQNILRMHMTEISQYIRTLNDMRNPAINEAVAARRSAEEFDLLRNMTAREIVIHILNVKQKKDSTAIAAIQQFLHENALEWAIASVDQFEPVRSGVGEISEIKAKGKLLFRNTSNKYGFNLRGCQLALSLDGQQQGELTDANWCRPPPKIGPGDTAQVDFHFEVRNAELISAVSQLAQQSQMRKVGWAFAPIKSSSVEASDGAEYQVSQESLNGFKADLDTLKQEMTVMQQK